MVFDVLLRVGNGGRFHILPLLDPCGETLLDLLLAGLRVPAPEVLPHHILGRLTEIEGISCPSEELGIADRLHVPHSTMVRCLDALHSRRAEAIQETAERISPTIQAACR
jgi:hypothetical protein